MADLWIGELRQAAAARAARPLLLAGLLLGLLAGCAGRPPLRNEALTATGQEQAARDPAVRPDYVAACPDVLSWRVTDRPELTGQAAIGADGRLNLGSLGNPRVEGRTLAEIAERLADEAGVTPAEVQVQVAEYHSQQVYIFGEVKGLQRAVAYRGPETLLELLQRAGGVTDGAEADNVYVVRSRVTDGRQPEVFRADLETLVEKREQKANVRIQPFDQVYIGATHEACVKRCMPPCLRPMYKGMCELPWPAWCRRGKKPPADNPLPARKAAVPSLPEPALDRLPPPRKVE